MKIELITLHAVKNYGSVLQAFATQEKLRKFGHEVTIINFIRKDTLDNNLLNTWCGKNILKKIIIYPTIIRFKKIFNSFLKSNLKLTDKVFTDEKDFINYKLESDVYFTGSDQVWNSEWNKGIIPPLYLSFIPKSYKKIAYSASFGNSILENWEVDQTKEYIKQYTAISVREDTALDILKTQYGFENCERIVDPTLAMEPSFWRNYTHENRIKYDYILIYQLNNNKEFDKYAEIFSKKCGLKLLRLCIRYDQIIKTGKKVILPEVFEFISLIDNAKYVITDSFHATAFALNLNTEPVCIYPQKFNSRLESILKLTGLQDRHISDFNDFSIINRKIDFKIVNQILDDERMKVDNFLYKVL